MSNERENTTLSYDEAKRSLVIRSACGTTTISVCDQGLLARLKGHHSTESWIIPGEYPLDEVSKFLAAQSLVNRVALSDALLESELWYARGYLDDPATWPREIFKKIPLHRFVDGAPKSYRNWMRAVVYDHPVFNKLSEQRIDRLIEAGDYPEKLHSIKYWKKFSLESLRHIIRYKAWKHPDWGLFASQYYDFYERIVEGHTEIWKEFADFVSACKRFAKTPKTHEIFDDIYRLGGSLRGTQRLKRVRDLVNYRDMLAERASNGANESALAGYKPPKSRLPKGWLWANATTFPKLGELYNCCISAAGLYGRELSEGDAAVAYRPAFDNENDRGALAYFVRIAKGEWRISQIKGWSNTQVDQSYEREAASFTSLLP